LINFVYMKTQKASVAIIVLVISLVLGGGYWYLNNSNNEESFPEQKISQEIEKENTEQENTSVKDRYKNSEQMNKDVVGHCGFVINSHKPNDLVEWPIIINGEVDQVRIGYNCFWQTFEGVSGTAQLYAYEDNNWIEIGDPVIFGPNFSINFNFTMAGLKINNPLKIIFTEENPAVQRPSLTFELPLILK